MSHLCLKKFSLPFSSLLAIFCTILCVNLQSTFSLNSFSSRLEAIVEQVHIRSTYSLLRRIRTKVKKITPIIIPSDAGIEYFTRKEVAVTKPMITGIPWRISRNERSSNRAKFSRIVFRYSNNCSLFSSSFVDVSVNTH